MPLLGNAEDLSYRIKLRRNVMNLGTGLSFSTGREQKLSNPTQSNLDFRIASSTLPNDLLPLLIRTANPGDGETNPDLEVMCTGADCIGSSYDIVCPF